MLSAMHSMPWARLLCNILEYKTHFYNNYPKHEFDPQRHAIASQTTIVICYVKAAAYHDSKMKNYYVISDFKFYNDANLDCPKSF